jgi:N-acyl-D-aspartate/D-glutamate deacylase
MRKQPLSKEEFERIWKSGLNLGVIVDSIPSSTIDFYARETDAPIGTDTSGFGHPRGIASFGKFIHQYVKGAEGEFALAVYRFSTEPAKWFSQYIPDLKERGLIQVGNYADLALWNLDEVKDIAGYGKRAPTSGVVALFVNGTPLILDGEEVRQNNPPGKWLKGRFAR